MKILHLLASGGIVGIENLIADYSEYSAHENIFVFCWEGGVNAERIAANGKRVMLLEKEKIGAKKLFSQLREIFSEEKPQAVIVHHEAPLLWMFILYISTKFPSVKTFCYAHCNAHTMVRDGERNMWLRKLICKCALRRCSRVIAISRSVEDSVVEYLSIPRSNVTVVYNGVNLGRFLPHLGSADEGLRLIYVGRLIRDKGVQGILAALSQIKNDRITLTIAGDGEYRSALEQQAELLGISNRVELLGARNDIPHLLAQADVFVHFPVCEEGFGITIIEAMASGLICVCGKSGAIPEIITHKSNGFLVEKGNVSMLASQLNSVIDKLGSPELDNIRTEALKTAEMFSAERFAQRLDKVVCE